MSQLTFGLFRSPDFIKKCIENTEADTGHVEKSWKLSFQLLRVLSSVSSNHDLLASDCNMFVSLTTIHCLICSFTYQYSLLLCVSSVWLTDSKAIFIYSIGNVILTHSLTQPIQTIRKCLRISSTKSGQSPS